MLLPFPKNLDNKQPQPKRVGMKKPRIFAKQFSSLSNIGLTLQMRFPGWNTTEEKLSQRNRITASNILPMSG